MLAWLPLLLSSPKIFLRPRIGVKYLKVVWARAESLTWLKKMLSLASILITINLIFWNWFFCCIDTCVTSLGGMKKKLQISVDLDLLMSSDSLSFDRNFTSPTRCCSGSPELWSPQFSLNFLSKLKNDLTWRQIPRPHFFLVLVESWHLE